MQSRLFRQMVLAAACLALIAVSPAAGADNAAGPDAVAPRVLFVVSGGAWSGGATLSTDSSDASGKETAKSDARGYYRLVAYRNPDSTARLVLEQFALRNGTPSKTGTLDLKQFDSLHAFVTDVRQDDTDGTPSTEGFSAFVTLKTDPKAPEAETWTVTIDEFGKATAAHESN